MYFVNTVNDCPPMERSLEAEVDRLRFERDKVKKEYKNYKKKTSFDHSKLSYEIKQNKELKSQLEELKSELEDINRLKVLCGERAGGLTHFVQDALKRQGEFERLQENLRKMEDLLKKASELSTLPDVLGLPKYSTEDTPEVTQGKFAVLEVVIDKFRIESTELKKEVHRLTIQTKKDQDWRRNVVRPEYKEVCALKAKCAELEAKAASVEMSGKLEQQLRASEDARKKQELTLISLTQRLQDQADKFISAATENETLKQLQVDHSRLQEQYAQAQAELRLERNRARNALGRAEHELEPEITKQRSRADLLSQKLEMVQEQLGNKEKQLVELMERLKENRQHSEAAEAMKKCSELLSQQVFEKEKAVSELREREGSLSAQLREARRQLETVKRSERNLREEAGKVPGLQKQVDQQQAELERVQHVLREKEAAIRGLLKSEGVLEEELRKVQRDHAHCEERADQIKGKILHFKRLVSNHLAKKGAPFPGDQLLLSTMDMDMEPSKHKLGYEPELKPMNDPVLKLESKLEYTPQIKPEDLKPEYEHKREPTNSKSSPVKHIKVERPEEVVASEEPPAKRPCIGKMPEGVPIFGSKVCSIEQDKQSLTKMSLILQEKLQREEPGTLVLITYVQKEDTTTEDFCIEDISIKEEPLDYPCSP